MGRTGTRRGGGVGSISLLLRFVCRKAKTDNTVSNGISTCVRKVCYFRSFVFIGRHTWEKNLF